MIEDGVINHEINFLTYHSASRNDLIRSIKTEFDFIQLCQGMVRPFGYDARVLLDRFMALSLRKLLCDNESLLKKICPNFKMPPLTGHLFDCPGDNNDIKLKAIWADIHVKPQSEWIEIDDWLKQKIAWIEKSSKDIPDAYSDDFFHSISKRLNNNTFDKCFVCEKKLVDGKVRKTWKIKNPEKNKTIVYQVLKENGYYDLTMYTLIKHFADKLGAHLDMEQSLWIPMENQGNDHNNSAISVFASQMIYASVKQIKGLDDYYIIEPLMETI